MRSYLDRVTLVPILEDPSDGSSDLDGPEQEEGMLWNFRRMLNTMGFLQMSCKAER